jgi:hypothetical protein
LLIPFLQFLILLIVVIYALTGEYYIWFKTGVPPVASFPAQRKKVIDILQREAASHSGGNPYTIIDLGSGSGQLSWNIARALPKAHVIGLELSFFPWVRSVVRQKLFGPANLQYKRINFWPYDCGEANVVVVFLTENIIERVSAKLRKELKPGALVVANDVWLRGDWQPIETHPGGFLNSKIYVYRQN